MSEENNQQQIISSSFFEDTERLEKTRMYDFVSALNALLKVLRLYSNASNEAVTVGSEKFADAMKVLFLSESMLALVYNGNDFLINDKRVKKKRRGPSMDELESFFLDLQIASISIPKLCVAGDVVNFAVYGQSIIKNKVAADHVFPSLEKWIKDNKSLISITQRDSSGGENSYTILEKAQLARLTYRNMIADQLLFRSKIERKQAMPIKKAMRNIQTAIDMISDGSDDSQETHFLVLSSINSFNNQLISTHMTNTAILSVAAGIQLGIDRALLTRIGMAAYFHDIALPVDSKGEVIEHGADGFAVLSRLNSLNFAMMEAAITAGLHHTTYTFDCKPIPPERPIMSTPLGELIKVCDFYDIATRWWPARKNLPMRRTQAIEELFRLCTQKCFAPVAVKALFSALGIFPPGTIVKIPSIGRLGCSIDVFKNTGKKGKVAILNNQMGFDEIQSFYAHELAETPKNLHFRLPPQTMKAILDAIAPVSDYNIPDPMKKQKRSKV